MFRLARLILFVGIGFYLGYKFKEMQDAALDNPQIIQQATLVAKESA